MKDSESTEPVEGEDEEVLQFDCDRASIHPLSTFAHTKDTVFFVNGYGRPDARIMFSDLETGYTGPLCGKPECLHNDTNCNASIPYSLRAFSCYGNELYYVRHKPSQNEDELIISQMDGSGRRSAGVIQGAHYAAESSYTMGAFHRGYVFFSGQESSIEEGEARLANSVIAFSLDKLSEEIVIYEEASRDSVHPATVLIQPYQDSLFYVLTELEMEEDQFPDHCKLTVAKWNLETKNQEILYSDIADFIPYGFFVLEDRILFTNGTDNRVMALRLSGNIIEEAFRVGDDERLISGFFGEDFIFARYYPDMENSRIVLTDFEGNVVLDQTEKRADYEYNGWMFLGSDEEHFYLHYIPSMRPIEAVVSVHRRTGEQKILSEQGQ